MSKKKETSAKKKLLKKVLGVDVSDESITVAELDKKKRKKLNTTIKY